VNEKIKWAASILAGLSGLFALSAVGDIVPAAYHKWVALAVAVTAYVAQWLESKIPARASGKATLTAALVLLLAGGATACGPTTWQEAVIRTADVMREATSETIPQLMTPALQKERATCLAMPDPVKKRTCLEGVKKKIEAWHTARAVLNSAVQTLSNIYKNFPAEGKDNAGK
jgi:hypothetical protein